MHLRKGPKTASVLLRKGTVFIYVRRTRGISLGNLKFSCLRPAVKRFLIARIRKSAVGTAVPSKVLCAIGSKGLA